MSKKRIAIWVGVGVGFITAFIWIGVPAGVFVGLVWFIFGPVIAIVIAFNTRSILLEENAAHIKRVDDRIAGLVRWKELTERANETK